MAVRIEILFEGIVKTVGGVTALVAVRIEIVSENRGFVREMSPPLWR